MHATYSCASRVDCFFVLEVRLLWNEHVQAMQMSDFEFTRPQRRRSMSSATQDCMEVETQTRIRINPGALVVDTKNWPMPRFFQCVFLFQRCRCLCLLRSIQLKLKEKGSCPADYLREMQYSHRCRRSKAWCWPSKWRVGNMLIEQFHFPSQKCWTHQVSGRRGTAFGSDNRTTPRLWFTKEEMPSSLICKPLLWATISTQ